MAALVGDAFAQSHTPLNILGSFKKAGIYPFNPEEVHLSDRQLAPSKAKNRLKEKEQADADAQKMEEEKKLERERKARERQEEKERKKLERQKEKERKAKEKLLKKAKKPRTATKRALSPVDTVRLESLFVQLDVEGNIPVVEWYSVKKMMKTGLGFVVIVTSGIALHATSC